MNTSPFVLWQNRPKDTAFEFKSECREFAIADK